MATVKALQKIYGPDDAVVAEPGDTLDLRDDVARWYVERGVAEWPPKATKQASPGKKDEPAPPSKKDEEKN